MSYLFEIKSETPPCVYVFVSFIDWRHKHIEYSNTIALSSSLTRTYNTNAPMFNYYFSDSTTNHTSYPPTLNSSSRRTSASITDDSEKKAASPPTPKKNIYVYKRVVRVSVQWLFLSNRQNVLHSRAFRLSKPAIVCVSDTVDFLRWKGAANFGLKPNIRWFYAHIGG